MSNIQVIGLGALNMDNIYRIERVLGDGERAANREQIERILGRGEAEVKWAGTFPGGSAANTIYGLAKLGVSAGFIGTVGDDTEGKALLHNFHEVGVDTGQIRVKPEAKTGSTMCLSDKLSFRSIYVIPGANSYLTREDLELHYVNHAEILHVSSFVDDRQFRILLELMDKLDSSVQVSFSPGSLYAKKGLKNLRPILSRTHTLFLNESEIRQLTGEEFKDGAKICLNQGCKTVVVTLGKGTHYQTVLVNSYIRTVDREYVVESSGKSETTPADTTGAGDAFAAGFLYGFLNRQGPEVCGRLGNIVAQFSIAKTGARQGLPTLDELAQRYQQLYNKQL